MQTWKKRIILLHQQLGIELPEENDKCAWLLLKRALNEALRADRVIFEAKANALLILIKYGWKDVFKESLNGDGNFKTDEEAGRFDYCHKTSNYL
jgi:hypothetical protein